MSSQFLDVKADGTTTQGAKGKLWGSLLEEATREVFRMMMNWETTSERCAEGMASSFNEICCERGKQPSIEVLFRSSVSSVSEDPEVTAVVGIAGELCGVLNFACGTSTARRMAARMLGIEEEDAGDQQWDAIGEICNMVAGNFKAKLPRLGERCMLSVPTIVVGSNYSLRAVAGGLRLRYCFQVSAMPCRITLELQQ